MLPQRLRPFRRGISLWSLNTEHLPALQQQQGVRLKELPWLRPGINAAPSVFEELKHSKNKDFYTNRNKDPKGNTIKSITKQGDS